MPSKDFCVYGSIFHIWHARFWYTVSQGRTLKQMRAGKLTTCLQQKGLKMLPGFMKCSEKRTRSGENKICDRARLELSGLFVQTSVRYERVGPTGSRTGQNVEIYTPQSFARKVNRPVGRSQEATDWRVGDLSRCRLDPVNLFVSGMPTIIRGAPPLIHFRAHSSPAPNRLAQENQCPALNQS